SGFHMTRYFGVFAGHHHLRARIIPPSAVPAPELQLALDLAAAANDGSDEPAESSPRPRRLGWAGLLARVFAVDVTVCRECGPRSSQSSPISAKRGGSPNRGLSGRNGADTRGFRECPKV